jgi:hypothetical protein
MTATDPNSPPAVSEGYDPFSYPHLYPSGWNLDDELIEHAPSANEASAAEPEPEPNPRAMPAWYEPFHDLRTFPAGWDLP